MMALGHHLRADDDVDLTRLDAADDLPHLASEGDQIGREQGDTGAWKALGHLLGNALDARARRRRGSHIAAFRALFGGSAGGSRNGGS